MTSEKTPLFVCRCAQKNVLFPPSLSSKKSSQHATYLPCLPCLFLWEVTPWNVWSSETVSNFAKVFGDEANPQSRPLVFENGEKNEAFFLKERDEVEWLLLGAGRKHRMFNFYTYLEPNDRPLFCGIDLHHFMGQILQNMGVADPCKKTVREDPIKAKSRSLLQMVMNSCPTGNQA